MRILLVSLSVGLIGACSATQPKSGWEYRLAHRAYAASLYYRFGDGEGTTLIGSCDGEPSFMLAGGSWLAGAPRFTLTVDGRSWSLPTRQGEHGHYLPVEQRAARQAVANANQRIVFEVGSWRREIRPAPPLKSFVTDCG